MLAKIGADRAENGQHLAEILSPNQRLLLRGSSWGICHAPTNDFFYVARLGVSATLQPTTCFTWLVLEYLPRSRSRLYRRRFLQVNMRWKALAEIYKSYMLFAPLGPQYFRKKSSNFFAFSANLRATAKRNHDIKAEITMGQELSHCASCGRSILAGPS